MSSTREELAAYAHRAWSGWIKYMFEKSTMNGEGEIVVPRWAVQRWTRQAETLYADLPESEKNSDRVEADEMLDIIGLDGSV